MIKNLLITPLDIIDNSKGDIMHIIKKSNTGYVDFGEAYITEIKPNTIKGWKRHRKMVLNLVVPIGKVRFVMFDDRDKVNLKFQEVILSKSNYKRLTIPPMVWVGFQGLDSEKSMVLNIASIEHDPFESDNKEIEEIKFNWEG